MKTIKFYVVAALLAICSSANAQFTNASSSSSSTSISSEGWSSFFLQYNPSKVVSDADGAEDLSFTGITAARRSFMMLLSESITTISFRCTMMRWSHSGR